MCLYYIANMKYCVGIRLTFSHLTLTNYNGQGQENFNCEYLKNGDIIRKTLLVQTNRKSCICIRLSYLHFTLTHSKLKRSRSRSCIFRLQISWTWGKVRQKIPIAVKYETGLSVGISTLDFILC